MSPSPQKSFNSFKCVSLLEVTQKRIAILRKKRSIIVKQSRDDVAKLLQRGQDANAAARAEHVYREQNLVGAYELLEQDCQLVIKGISAIKSQKDCSLELKQAIASLIYAAPRCGDLQELQKVRDLFISSYGADYVAAILELRPGCVVNTQIVHKLSSLPPNSDVRLNLLKEIALEYKIDWNYQRAVAASFKNGETSKNSKVSPNGSLDSKHGFTDDVPFSIPVDGKSKKPTASLAVQSAIPVEASVNESEPFDSPKTNPSLDVTGKSANKPGHMGKASSVKHNSSPLVVHESSPRERDFMVANKVSSIGSPTIVDKFVHQDRAKGNASLTTHNSASSKPRKEDVVKTEHVSAADKQKPNSSFMHQDDELKGCANSRAINTSSSSRPRYGNNLASSKEVLDVGILLKVKPASVFAGQEFMPERSGLGLHTAYANRALPSREKSNPIQPLNASISALPRESSGPVQQATSTPAFFQANVFPSKTENQCVRADETYDKVVIAKTDEDFRGKNLPQMKAQPKNGAVDPASKKMIDAYAESMAVNHNQSFHQQTSSSFYAMTKEAVGNFADDYGRNQLKGPHHQRVFSSAETYERSRGEEKLDRVSSFVQARNQHEEHQKCFPIAGLNTRSYIPPSELRSLKVEVDKELADLEIAIASAARAADAALDMVRTCSTKGRANKEGFQGERDYQRRKSNGGINTKIGFESRKAFHSTLNQQDRAIGEEMHTHSTVKGGFHQKEPYQDQEPVSLDSEMPHFDDSSSDSSKEEPSPHTTSRLPFKDNHIQKKLANKSTMSFATPVGTQGWSSLNGESLHVFAQNFSQKETFYDDDCAESIYSFSPKSSSSSKKHLNADVASLQNDVQPSYKKQLNYDEEACTVGAQNALPSNNNIFAPEAKTLSRWHGIGSDKVSDMECANEDFDKGGNVGKKNRTLGNVQPWLQPHKQDNAMASQNSVGKSRGVSMRSVRPAGPTRDG